jgi:hypothetical protein
MLRKKSKRSKARARDTIAVEAIVGMERRDKSWNRG